MVLDLPHGILSLDDFPFSPQTTMDELLTSGLPVRASSCDYFCATSPVSVDGTDFLPEFSFLAGHLLRLILRPCIEYPASMADQCERQQFRLSYVLVGCLSDWAGRQNNRRAKIATSSLGDISALWLTSLPEASIMRATLF